METVLRSLQEGVLVVSAEGNVDYATPTAEAMLGFEVSAPARLPVVQADAVQLRQAFFNLVHNAVQAMGEGGRLAIALTADDRDLVVAFRDSSSGIDREDFGRLFEPFHTTKAEGHGIGLSVVQRIVRTHGGRIDVASKPGEGTCFRISLPLADRRARLLPGAPPPPPSALRRVPGVVFAHRRPRRRVRPPRRRRARHRDPPPVERVGRERRPPLRPVARRLPPLLHRLRGAVAPRSPVRTRRKRTVSRRFV